MIGTFSDPTWSDLEYASTQPLDLDQVRAIARRRLSVGASSPRDLETAVGLDLMHAFGSWIGGWSWACSEPGGGGPVRAWCCPEHSLTRGEPTIEPAVERIAAAVAEWHAFLGELGDEFRALRQQLENIPVAEATERAAARIITLTIGRTGAEDAWYRTFATILNWFLESFGLKEDVIEDAVEEVASGHFQSWVGPSPEVAHAASQALGAAVANARWSEVDATAAWRSNRHKAFYTFYDDVIRSFRVSVPDGHRSYIDTIDAERDPSRAELMHLVLDLCRESAARDEPLNLALLQAWQSELTGDPTIRTDMAWARGGRVSYGTFHPEKFDANLRQANNRDEPVALRAARVYLDICFFHPFNDGNARTARLALDHVITREGLVLHAAAPLFRLCRSALDVGGARQFVSTVEACLGKKSSC